METKRAILKSPGEFEIITDNIEPKSDELLVKVEACGLCNWELNHYTGVQGNCPQFLGHEWAGTVISMGSEVQGFAVGDKITVMPVYVGFAEYAVVDYRKAYKLKPDTDLRKAIGEPLKCVVTVTRAARPSPGDFGVIFGCGPMGLWASQILSGNMLSGLIAVDTDDSKLELAKKYGVSHVLNPKKCDLFAEMAAITGGHMADFVIEATGIPEILNDCFKLLRTSGRGRVILMSSHKRPGDGIDFREMVSRSAELIVAHAKYSEDQDEDIRRAIRFLEQGVIKMDDIITHTYSLSEIGKAFEDLMNKPQGYIKGIVLPNN